MGIETIIAMIPKGGKYAKSVVNFVHKVPQNWEKFKSAIQQIEGILKQGKLRLDGKQKTIFESNKNILKNHEKVTKKVEESKLPVKKEPWHQGWTPKVLTGGKKFPPERLYTKEMEKIDNELDELIHFGKYDHVSPEKKAAYFKELQSKMNDLIKKAMNEDLSKLSLSQINKRTHEVQKRIREVADNPNIQGTVSEGPKRDMIKVIADERKALDTARYIIKRKNAELKYGTKFPRLDPENDAWIIVGIDETGSAMKMSRFTGKFSATKDPKTGDLTKNEGTSFYDTWDIKKNQMRESGKEVFHETIGKDGKVIMSNPDYKLPENINKEIWSNLYGKDLELDKIKNLNLKEIDMLRKGREVKKYIEAKEAAETNLDTYQKTHERTSTSGIGDIMEDLYNRSDDIYKMSIKEWVKKIPEYFAGGGRVAYGEGTGGVSNFFKNKLKKYTREGIDEDQEKWLKEKGLDMTVEEWQAKDLLEKLVIAGKLNLTMIPGVDDLEKGVDYATGGIADFRQGFRAGTAIELVKGARWLIKMLKEMMDDMIFGRAQFAKMTEALKMKYFKETEAAVKHLEAGGAIPENLIQTMRADKRFKNLTVSKGGDKDFQEMQEIVLGKTTIGTGEKILEGTVVESSKPVQGYEDMKKWQNRLTELMEFKKTLPKDLLDKVNILPEEKQMNLLRVMKQAFDAAKKGNIKSGVDVLQEQLLTDFIPKGKPHATGGLIDGYATGGVSNLFRQRYRSGKAVEVITKLPEFLKFVEGLLIKASNEIRQGLGKWKGLDIKQKTVQHDNLTKMVTEFQKTKKFDPKMNEYFGIDAEKAFIAARDKATRLEKKGPNWKEQEVKAQQKERTMDDLVEDAYQEVFYQKPRSGDYKYDADVLATEIAYQGGKIYDDLAAVEKAGIYDLAYKRVIKDLQINRAKKIAEKNLTDLEQKIELQMFDTTGKKGNAEGGLIGYATGGVSNLFRRR